LRFLDFFRRGSKRPRVFLGSLGVEPRSGLTDILEGSGPPGAELTPHRLLGDLREVFELPRSDETQDVIASDLALDIFVAKYQFGLFAEAFALPLIWRPSVKLKARLYYLKSGKLVRNFSVTAKPTWREYVNSMLSQGLLPRLGRPLGDEQVRALHRRAALKLLEQVIKAAYR